MAFVTVLLSIADNASFDGTAGAGSQEVAAHLEGNRRPAIGISETSVSLNLTLFQIGIRQTGRSEFHPVVRDGHILEEKFSVCIDGTGETV
jgi:hypothetical protein